MESVGFGPNVYKREVSMHRRAASIFSKLETREEGLTDKPVQRRRLASAAKGIFANLIQTCPNS